MPWRDLENDSESLEQVALLAQGELDQKPFCPAQSSMELAKGQIHGK